MGLLLAARIEAWFSDHSEDDEFVSHSRAVPYSVIGSSTTVCPTIFTSKPCLLLRALDGCVRDDLFGVIGRYGLPNGEDLQWIDKLVGSNKLLFLGDMDPVDLMVFAWLRTQLNPKRLEYLGIGDTLLSALQIHSVESLTIPCAPSELVALSVLELVLPDLRETVGVHCENTLKKGLKIELEAVVNYKENVTNHLLTVIKRRH